MERDDVEGAIAAAQYFLELYPYAYNTGDLEDWRAMSHPDCVFCASVIENVEELHAEGGYQFGGQVTWESAEGSEAASDVFSIDALTYQAPTFEVRGADEREISSGGRALLFIDVERRGTWLIRAVDVEDLEE